MDRKTAFKMCLIYPPVLSDYSLLVGYSSLTPVEFESWLSFQDTLIHCQSTYTCFQRYSSS